MLKNILSKIPNFLILGLIFVAVANLFMASIEVKAADIVSFTRYPCNPNSATSVFYTCQAENRESYRLLDFYNGCIQTPSLPASSCDSSWVAYALQLNKSQAASQATDTSAATEAAKKTTTPGGVVPVIGDAVSIVADNTITTDKNGIVTFSNVPGINVGDKVVSGVAPGSTVTLQGGAKVTTLPKGSTTQKTITVSLPTSNTTTPVDKTAPGTSTTSSTCTVTNSSIKWYSIVTPVDFLPIIPAECGQDGTTIKPLSIKLLPEIIIRLFGFLVALVWYLLLPVFIFAGIWYIWGGIDGTSSGAAMSLLQNSFLSILSLLFFFIIVFTVLSLLGGGAITSTNLSSIFN